MASIIPSGIDNSSGQRKPVGGGDTLVDSTGSPITGLQGSTGIQGNTGISPAGGSGQSYAAHFSSGASASATGTFDFAASASGILAYPVPQGGRATKIVAQIGGGGSGTANITVNGTFAGALSNGGSTQQAFTIGSPVTVSAGGTIVVAWNTNSGSIPNTDVIVFVEP